MVKPIKSSNKFMASAVAMALATSAIVPIASAATGFSDVLSTNSHAENIKQAVEMGIIKGQNGKFRPNDTITRGQVVKILARYLESKHGKKSYSKVLPFADIPANSKDKELYNASRVVKYHEALLVENNKLRPSDKMTREEMASVLVATFGLELDGKTVNVTDLNQVGRNHASNVQIIANLGITQTENGRFSPKQAVTRAQFASFFVRTIDGYGGIPQSAKGLKISNVVGVEGKNHMLRVDFSRALTKLTAANIDIRNAKSGANYPVKAVKLAEGGKSAQIELFENFKDDRENVGDYHITVTIGGEKLTYSFNRSTYMESFVTDVDVKKNKITIFTDKGTTKAIDFPSTGGKLDIQQLLGEKVGIWYDSKNKPTDIEQLSRRAKYDAIEIKKVDEIRLISADKEYKISTKTAGTSGKPQFSFYLDGKKVEIGGRDDTKKKVKVKDRFTHAKIGFDDSGKILSVNAYNLNEFLIVDRIKDDEVIGYPGEGTGGVFNAKDALIIKDGNVIKHSDLRRGDVLFFSKVGNKGKGIAEVANPIAKGKIESVSSRDVQIDGKTYRYNDNSDLERYKVNYGSAVYLHNDGKTEKVDAQVASALQNAGTASVYADRAGNVVYIAGGSVKVERKTSVAVLLADIIGDRQSSREFIEVEALLATGEKKWFTSDLDGLTSIIVDDVTYDISGKSNWKVSFEYKDEKNMKEPTAILLTSKTDKQKIKVPLTKTRGQLVRLHMNRDHSRLESIEFFKKRSASKKIIVKSSDTHISGKRLNSDTIVFDTEYFNARDIEVTTWGKYKGPANVATIIFDENNNIIAFITDAAPKAFVLPENVATLTSEMEFGEMVITTAEIQSLAEQLGMPIDSTVASADEGKGSELKMSILPIESDQQWKLPQ